MERKLKNGVAGEDLNLLIGSIPATEEGKEQVKLNILKILNKKYFKFKFKRKTPPD